MGIKTKKISARLGVVAGLLAPSLLVGCAASSPEAVDAVEAEPQAEAEARTKPHVEHDARPNPRVRTTRLLSKMGTRRAAQAH